MMDKQAIIDDSAAQEFGEYAEKHGMAVAVVLGLDSDGVPMDPVGYGKDLALQQTAQMTTAKAGRPAEPAETANQSVSATSQRRPHPKASLSPAAEAHLLEIPRKWRKTYRQAMEGRSYPAAVKAHCHMCMSYENPVKAIRGCDNTTCPLFAKRPYQTDAESADAE